MGKQTLIQGPHQSQKCYHAGQPLEKAKAAMILLHGRGADANDILQLANELYHPDYAYLAPQAAGNTWYPYSFLAPLDNNEPGLSSGLQAIADALTSLETAGISAKQVIIGGFSQGACLASEFVARNAQRYGGLIVFSGGLIGPPGTPRNYEGSVAGTPIFLGCSNVDPHIPKTRVHESSAVFKKMGGTVTEKIYPNMPHTVIQDEIEQVKGMITSLVAS